MTDNQDFISRLQEFILYKKVAITVFESTCDIKRNVISAAIKNNGSIGSDKLSKISTTYPELNMDWLLSGKGEMLNISIEKNLNVQQNNGDGDNNHCILNVGEANEKLQQLEAENRYLKKEIELKDKIISLLESKN